MAEEQQGGQPAGRRPAEDGRTLALLAGLGLIGYGVWQIHQPSAYIVTGAILAGTALLATLVRAIARPRKGRPHEPTG